MSRRVKGKTTIRSEMNFMLENLEQRAPSVLQEYLLRFCFAVQIEVKLQMLQSRIFIVSYRT